MNEKELEQHPPGAAMGLGDLDAAWEADLEQLKTVYVARVHARIREIVGELRNFKINRVLVGMGTWTWQGDDFPVVFDGEEYEEEYGPIMKSLRELQTWIMGYDERKEDSHCDWRPKHIDQDEIALLRELQELQAWSEDRTELVDFKAEWGHCYCEGPAEGSPGPLRPRPVDLVHLGGNAWQCRHCHAIWVPE